MELATSPEGQSPASFTNVVIDKPSVGQRPALWLTLTATKEVTVSGGEMTSENWVITLLSTTLA